MFKLSKNLMTICNTIGIIARALFSGQKGPKRKGQGTVYISLANMAVNVKAAETFMISASR